MRWEGLFADLESQAQSLEALDRSAEIEERTRSEVGRLRLAARLRAGVGAWLQLRCLGGLALAGTLTRAYPQWLLIAQADGRECLVSTASVLSVQGLNARAVGGQGASLLDDRLSLPLILRRVARDRSPVRVHLVDGALLDGTLDRVGLDYLELALHPPDAPRRPAAVREALVLATAAVVAVRRHL